ncbi:MAG TPA: hypothetical protein VKG79_06925 [Bryobacteraceae bacterium]|nr:hypothetical protein [Bryobacteraceae bacterium]
MNHIAFASLVSLVSFTAPANADPMTFQLPEETAVFKPGPGVETATARCRTCHSVDYISTQPPNRGKFFWETEVQKMTKVFKAQISPSDAAAIADYLAATY